MKKIRPTVWMAWLVSLVVLSVIGPSTLMCGHENGCPFISTGGFGSDAGAITGAILIYGGIITGIYYLVKRSIKSKTELDKK